MPLIRHPVGAAEGCWHKRDPYASSFAAHFFQIPAIDAFLTKSRGDDKVEGITS